MFNGNILVKFASEIRESWVFWLLYPTLQWAKSCSNALISFKICKTKTKKLVSKNYIVAITIFIEPMPLIVIESFDNEVRENFYCINFFY